MALTSGDVFHAELRSEAARYFATRSDRDAPALYAKAAVMLTWFVASWVLLVFVAHGIAATLALTISTALALAGLGMGLGHDANHGAVSRRPWVNNALGAALDVMGMSTYVWRVKHNVVHHSHTNIVGVDDDLDAGPFARFAPDQRRRRAHRWQHLYMWPLYGALHLKWVWLDDWICLARGRVARHPLRRPRGRDLAVLICGKAGYLAWALVVPALFHPIVDVLALYLVGAITVGVTFAVTFQLAHCVEIAEFPSEAAGGFAAHQMATTVDFAPRGRILRWYVGGLNYQIEHHLFPRVCHVHYPALSRIVADVAARHGIRYRVIPTMTGALASHFRHLRNLGAV